jgi:hypothetical protein
MTSWLELQGRFKHISTSDWITASTRTSYDKEHSSICVCRSILKLPLLITISNMHHVKQDAPQYHTAGASLSQNFCMNDVWHASKANGRTPQMLLQSNSKLEKSSYTHTKQNNATLFKAAVKWYFQVNDFLYRSQEKGNSPVWVSRCCFKSSWNVYDF